MRNYQTIILVITFLFPALSVTAQNLQWATDMGGAYFEYATSITVAPSGNVYVTGNYDSSGLLNGNNFFLGNDIGSPQNMFIIKLDSNGKILWAHHISGMAFLFASGISLQLDSKENIYVSTTYLADQIFIGPDVFPSYQTDEYDILIKFDSAGNYLWARQAGTVEDYETNIHHTTDLLDNNYIMGKVKVGNVVFDSISFSTQYNLSTRFLVSLNSEGHSRWGIKFSSEWGNFSHYFDLNSLFIDRNSIINVVGRTGGDSLKIGNNLKYMDSLNYFILSVDTLGNVLNISFLPIPVNQCKVYSTIVDSKNNYYFAGTFFSDTLFFDSSNYLVASDTLANASDIWIIKTDSNFNIIKIASFGGNRMDYFRIIKTDANNNVYLSGKTDSDTLFFINGFLKKHQYQETFVFMLDDNLIPTPILSNTSSWTHDFFVDSSGDLFIACEYYRDSVFGFLSLPLHGFGDVVVAKFGINTAISNQMVPPESFLLYPNPVSKYLYLSYGFKAGSVIEIYDISGRKILEKRINASLTKVDVSNYPKGIYIVRVIGNDNKVTTSKFIKE